MKEELIKFMMEKAEQFSDYFPILCMEEWIKEFFNRFNPESPIEKLVWNHIMLKQPEHGKNIVRVDIFEKGDYCINMIDYYPVVPFEEYLKGCVLDGYPFPDFWWMYTQHFPFPVPGTKYQDEYDSAIRVRFITSEVIKTTEPAKIYEEHLNEMGENK